MILLVPDVVSSASSLESSILAMDSFWATTTWVGYLALRGFVSRCPFTTMTVLLWDPSSGMILVKLTLTPESHKVFGHVRSTRAHIDNGCGGKQSHGENRIVADYLPYSLCPPISCDQPIQSLLAV